MRNKVNDFSVDKVFDNSDIHRSTDDIGARDGGGKLLANTAAEAEKYRIWLNYLFIFIILFGNIPNIP